jgi:FlaA1/EpsC-like NDP-sugar epimerase
MGSRGSVIPFFLQKRAGGVIPITDDRMTRFNITLQEGVDFVLASLQRMWGGELFVPRIPSYRILDVAKAVAPEAKTQIVGIRPGEKLHEEMITSTDAIGTVEFDDYFVILPSMQLWDTEKFLRESGAKPGKRCEFGFSYSSDSNKHFLGVDELRTLVAQEMHGK